MGNATKKASFMSLPLEVRVLIYEYCGIREFTVDTLDALDTQNNLNALIWVPKGAYKWMNISILKALLPLRPIRQLSRRIRGEVDNEIHRANCWRFKYQSMTISYLPHKSTVAFIRKAEINFYPNSTYTFLRQFLAILPNIGHLAHLESLNILIGTESRRNLSRYLDISGIDQLRARFHEYVSVLPLKWVTLESVHKGKIGNIDRRAAKRFEKSIVHVLEQVATDYGANGGEDTLPLPWIR